MAAARRLGLTLLLNAFRPKRMVPQPDTAPACDLDEARRGASAKCGLSEPQGRGTSCCRPERAFPPSSIVRRRGVPRRFG